MLEFALIVCIAIMLKHTCLACLWMCKCILREVQAVS